MSAVEVEATCRNARLPCAFDPREIKGEPNKSSTLQVSLPAYRNQWSRSKRDVSASMIVPNVKGRGGGAMKREFHAESPGTYGFQCPQRDESQFRQIAKSLYC
jgi:hypothetical protein